MGILQSIVLGIIQGLAEFLPISSSGHLAIIQNFFPKFFGGEVPNSFDVLLHIGTLVAVFVVFYKDIWELIKEFCGIVADICVNIVTYFKALSNHEQGHYRKILKTPYRRFTMLIIVACIPTAIIGLIFEKMGIDESASSTLIVPGICMLVTAVMLFISDQLPDGEKNISDVKWYQAGFIGIAQGIATLPGISRSGATITAGLVCGVKRDLVVKFSFLMSIPAILGATLLKVPDMKNDFATTTPICYIVGILTAAIVGYVAIKVMLSVVRNKKFKYFSYYCAVIGLIAIVGSFFIKN